MSMDGVKHTGVLGMKVVELSEMGPNFKNFSGLDKCDSARLMPSLRTTPNSNCRWQERDDSTCQHKVKN